MFFALAPSPASRLPRRPEISGRRRGRGEVRPYFTLESHTVIFAGAQLALH